MWFLVAGVVQTTAGCGVIGVELPMAMVLGAVQASLGLWEVFRTGCSLGCGRLMSGECCVVVLLVLQCGVFSLLVFL